MKGLRNILKNNEIRTQELLEQIEMILSSVLEINVQKKGDCLELKYLNGQIFSLTVWEHKEFD